MEERMRFVLRRLDGEPMSDLCREFGISRKTGYKIFDRYQSHGLEALSDRSRRPVRYANHLLVDGGVVNPLPLDQASNDVDILVGIDVNGDPSQKISKTDHRALDLWFGSAQIMMHALTAHMMAAYPPDVYARPHVSSFGAMEFWRVKDCGPGIPLGDRELIFRRFWRRDRRRPGSSGLGLSIVARIAELHGAELTFDEAAGGGLAVTVTFPAV